MNAKKVTFASKAELLNRRTKSTCTPPSPSGILKTPRRASEAQTALGSNKENELPAAESPVKIIVAPRKMRSLSDAEVSEIFGDDTSLCKHRKSEVEKLIDDQRRLNLTLGPGEKRTRRKPKAFGELQENTEEKSAKTPRKKAEKPPQRPRARTDYRAESIAAPKKRRGRPTKTQKQTKVPVEKNVRTPIPEPNQPPRIEQPLATDHMPVIDPPAPEKSLAESIQFARFPEDVKHFPINEKISYCRLTASVGMIQMSGEKNHFHFKNFLFFNLLFCSRSRKKAVGRREHLSELQMFDVVDLSFDFISFRTSSPFRDARQL